jgi:uncharacterized membrane protein YeaQ/YmgE (transglycosylase-associated protein family)
MDLIISLIIGLFTGWWGQKIMERKGRNESVGFWLGFLLNFFGVIICYIHSSNVSKKQSDVLDRNI